MGAISHFNVSLSQIKSKSEHLQVLLQSPRLSEVKGPSLLTQFCPMSEL